MAKKKELSQAVPQNMRQTAQESAMWLLSQNSGNNINGREMTNLDMLLSDLMETGHTNAQAAMTMLALGGVIQDHSTVPTEAQKKEQERMEKERKAAVAAAEKNIKEELKKDGIYSTSLIPLVRSAAMLKVQLDKIAEKVYNEPSYIMETSREGASRMKPNPVVDTFMRYVQQYSNILSMLIHRARQLAGKQQDDEENSLVKTLQELNDITKFKNDKE